MLDFIFAEVKLYQKIITPIEEKYDLTSMELTIILFLASNPNQDTATELINIKHLTKSHVSTSISSLEEKGFLRKTYLNGNNRTVHLTLTDKVSEIVSDGRIAQSEFVSVLRKGFSEKENDLINNLFKRINDNVNDALNNDRKKDF